MSMQPGSIHPGMILGVVTFFTILSLPYDSPQALWWAISGLCALVMVQTVLTARAGNPLGVLSLAIAAVITLSAVAELAAPHAGVDIAGYPKVFGLFLAIIVGFPLGVLAVSDPFMPPLAALFWGIMGVAYMPLPMWLSARLGLTGYMIDVFAPQLRFGHLVGMEKTIIGIAADVLGMSMAAGVTLVILSLPALPLVLLIRHLVGRS
jgi:hypothetical protein